ncbi:MAG: sensor domain-containing phosphodiesterase [Eubacterium sp.]|nr:sensor domain-containing phosphodiesterase [Eubacterium sp.]
MSARVNLTETECVALIKYISDALVSKNTESAVAAIVEKLRETFDVTVVSIREIFSRPCSLRYTYEALCDSTKERRVNEIISFDEDVWQSALDKFADGCYIYKAGGEQSAPKFIGPVPVPPKSMIQIPMYNGAEFFGVLDLVDFEEIRDWSDSEISTLTACANFICQYLYRLSSLAKVQGREETDPLTGLMSFRAFTDSLDAKLSEMLNDSPVAVVYSDINHFKYINETYGYKKGDELLKLTAQHIIDGVERERGVELMLCRAHADNFISAAVVPEETIPMFENYIHAQNKQLSKFLQDNCPDVRIRLYTGICYVRDRNTTAATAIAYANLARKIAKRDHLKKPLVFSDEMMDDIKYQEYLNNELPKAIENHDLKVFYQPKINCLDDSLYGAEALVRWQKPDGTFIYPDKFIPVFEKNGNIVDVDFYVYREVFRYLRGRLDAGLSVFPISMNVSRAHFRSDKIIPYIEGLFREYKIPPELVEFELTENIYMNNFSKADEFIKSCRDRGMQVSMDDFGSGYSSLNVISSLAIDTLKIDRIFLKNDNLSDNDKTVIESMIAMAKRLGMKVICEGVETESQMRFLKKALCDQIQGFYYGRPMDEETFNKFAAQLTG